MQRFFYHQPLQTNETIRLEGEIFHQLSRVLRKEEKDQFLLVDATSITYLVEIYERFDQFLVAKILEPVLDRSEMPIPIAIACGLSKNDKLEWIVQKATECGMHEFYPLTLKRDVMQWNEGKALKKISRLQKIAQEAAEQSQRNLIPKIHRMNNLKELLEIASQYSIKIVAYEETAKSGTHTALAKVIQNLRENDQILAVFGSEGGLMQTEVDQLVDNGFVPCSLGPRILRAETAPIYFLSAISYQLELKGEQTK